MLKLKELKEMHDKSYNSGTVNRERAADDILFYWVTQWDDNLLGDAQLQYRGEFNIIRKAGRQIIADLRSNPVQIDFDPKADSREDGADLLDGLYLSDDRINTTIEAYDNASLESVVGGVGAWELCPEYESSRTGSSNQVIRRKPVYEANNNCYWDPNAKLLDKSDATYVSILVAYSHDGYKALVLDLTGEELGDAYMESFKYPEESYTFPWAAGESEKIYVSTFYHRKLVKDKVLTMVDPDGQAMFLRESDLTDVMDDLIDEGYTIEDDKEIERWEITKYIASGADILSTDTIAGQNIPVVPVYGERAFVEGEEHYEGITRLAKDPQRLRNFQMSYLADIVSRSPRNKPIFNPEQIQGFEHMYEDNGADNNFPYYLQNRFDGDGNPLTLGPVGEMPEQRLPTSLMASIDLTRQAVEDVANPGVPQDIADPDLSGKAVLALQARLDNQSMVYQQNFKHAKRRDGEIYASMATEIYDAPRKVTITLPDGTRKKEDIMSTILDEESGELVVLNDLTNMEFDVYADIGPSYSSKQEKTAEQLESMASAAAQTDPAMHKMILLTQLTMLDGVATKDMRNYANQQLVLGGFKEAETDEEKALVQQAQQNQEPDPNALLAQAEQTKGDAQMLEAERKFASDQATAEDNQAKRQIDVFKAQTDRMSVQVEAQEAGATIDFKRIQTIGQRIDNRLKATEPFRARLAANPS